jgi:hypothetical protein
MCSTTNRSAIAVLTRGYGDIQQYQMLIERNRAIDRYLPDKTVDLLFFHEGNILPDHQRHIQQSTPSLNMKFINIKENGRAFSEDKQNISVFPYTSMFPMSYRHMCSFWFCYVYDFLVEYDYILRIDEDCEIAFDLSALWILLKDKLMISGASEDDEDYVTYGLNQFTLDFLARNQLRGIPKVPGGPYTNLAGFNLIKIRENRLIQDYIREVEKHNGIYIYRWGDMPLWGEILYYFCDPSDYLETDLIRYKHHSHRAEVHSGKVFRDYSSQKLQR